MWTDQCLYELVSEFLRSRGLECTHKAFAMELKEKKTTPKKNDLDDDIAVTRVEALLSQLTAPQVHDVLAAYEDDDDDDESLGSGHNSRSNSISGSMGIQLDSASLSVKDKDTKKKKKKKKKSSSSKGGGGAPASSNSNAKSKSGSAGTNGTGKIEENGTSSSSSKKEKKRKLSSSTAGGSSSSRKSDADARAKLKKSDDSSGTEAPAKTTATNALPSAATKVSSSAPTVSMTPEQADEEGGVQPKRSGPRRRNKKPIDFTQLEVAPMSPEAATYLKKFGGGVGGRMVNVNEWDGDDDLGYRRVPYNDLTRELGKGDTSEYSYYTTDYFKDKGLNVYDMFPCMRDHVYFESTEDDDDDEVIEQKNVEDQVDTLARQLEHHLLQEKTAQPAGLSEDEKKEVRRREREQLRLKDLEVRERQRRRARVNLVHDMFKLKVVYVKNKTGFEESKDFPIKIDGIIAGRYQIQEYLGSAAFSKAVQCLDMESGRKVCIKIITNNKDFFDQSMDEIKLLTFIKNNGDCDAQNVLQLFDYFYYKEHLFLVTELLRDNLYEFYRYNRDSGDELYFTRKRLKRVSRQVLEALKYIHSLNLIHCDLKPENILIKSYSRCEIKVIDFGSSCFNTDHLSSYVQSRAYRAPEVILGLPYNAKIDIWSLGCIIAELYTGNVLFLNDSIATLFSRVLGIIGPMPRWMLKRGRHAGKYFTDKGMLWEKKEEHGKQQMYYLFPKRTTLKSRLNNCKDDKFVDFVECLLNVDPNKRPTADEALQHEFLRED